jgi:hypothetical protein
VVFAPLFWHSRRTRFATILIVVIAVASLTEVWWYPHYAAPFTAALLIPGYTIAPVPPAMET